MTTPPIDPLLVEAAASAWRPRDADGRVGAHPAWCDLAPEHRGAAFEVTLAQHEVEAAIDPRGWSSTVHAVLARITRLR